jgi:hypothetical protein
MLPRANLALAGAVLLALLASGEARAQDDQSYDPDACTRLEDLGIEIVETWSSAQLDYAEGLIDRSELEWRFGNLKNHLENYEREAGFAGCDQLAADMEWVLGEMTMP